MSHHGESSNENHKIVDLRNHLQSSTSKNPSGASSLKAAKEILAKKEDRWWLDYNFKNESNHVIEKRIATSFNMYAKKLNNLKYALGNASASTLSTQVEYDERLKLAKFDSVLAKSKLKDFQQDYEEQLKEFAATAKSKEKYKKLYYEVVKKFDEIDNELAGEKWHVEKLDRENRQLRRRRDKDEDYITQIKRDYVQEKDSFEKSLYEMAEANKKLNAEKASLEGEMEILKKQVGDKEAEDLFQGRSTSKPKNEDLVFWKARCQGLEDERDGLRHKVDILMAKYEDCSCKTVVKKKRSSKRRAPKNSTPEKIEKSARKNSRDTGYSNELSLSE